MQRYEKRQGQFLLEVARTSIVEYLRHHRKWRPSHSGVDPALLLHGACFVTLHREGQLRGCIGSLEPVEPLIDNVANNAWAAAFSDPRFDPVTADEAQDLHIDLSVLGLPSPLIFDSEEALIAQMRPGQDGLILLTPQGGRATFLPSVWEQLPDPAEFLQHLKRKAGLPAHYWHPAMRAERYEVQYFEEDRQT